MPGATATFESPDKKSGTEARKAGTQDILAVPEEVSLLPSPQDPPFPSFDSIKNEQQPDLVAAAKNFRSSFNNSQRPQIPQFDTSQQSIHAMSPALGQLSAPHNTASQAFVPSLFDSHDPTLLDFDIPSMNFGNHYGALEFGMLGHMSSTAGPYDGTLQGAGYMDGLEDQNDLFMHRNSSNSDWQTRGSAGSLQMQPYTNQLGSTEMLRRGSTIQPHAYAIGAGPGSGHGASPGSTSLDSHHLYDNNSNAILDQSILTQSQPPNQRNSNTQLQVSPRNTYAKPSEAISAKLRNLPATTTMPRTKRRRDPSDIYNSVTQPYPYTAGFHALTAVIYKRFSSQNRLRIAQALAAIRPSFISCTRNLIDADLVFMEKCFQRQLLEYQDFVTACGTPTIVCRRTGEVAHVGKEFALLTGWSREVLLGLAPNLNANKHEHSGSGVATLSSSRGGYNTPRTAEGSSALPTRPQPVFLAELLDDDSVIQFYEDFAKLAFADSKGSVWSPCKLLKYKSPEAEADLTADGTDANVNTSTSKSGGNKATGDGRSSAKQRRRSTMVAGYGGGSKGLEPIISAEDGIRKLGDKDGKVDCVYCWMVRRDVFDIPMMIVINVSDTTGRSMTY